MTTTEEQRCIPIGESLAQLINDAVNRAREKYETARTARTRAAGCLMPHERDLVLKPLPKIAECVLVSPDALFALLNADSPDNRLVDRIVPSMPNGAAWRLRGCGLPLVVNNDLRVGMAYTLATLRGEGAG